MFCKVYFNIFFENLIKLCFVVFCFAAFSSWFLSFYFILFYFTSKWANTCISQSNYFLELAQLNEQQPLLMLLFACVKMSTMRLSIIQYNITAGTPYSALTTSTLNGPNPFLVSITFSHHFSLLSQLWHSWSHQRSFPMCHKLVVNSNVSSSVGCGV